MTERVNNTIENMSELRLTAPPSPITATINAQNAGNNTNVDADNSSNIFESGTPTVAFNSTSVPNPPLSSTPTPVSPSPSVQVVAQAKFLHQRKAEVRKQLQLFKSCDVKFTTSNEYHHYENELSKTISEYGMLPIMIFKGQIVIEKLTDLYDKTGIIRYVEKAPSERYSILYIQT